MKQALSAEVIYCAGRIADERFPALEVRIDGLRTPYHMILALPAVTSRGVSGQVDAAELYQVLARAINQARATVEVST
jgi:hypothetical protein